MAYVSDELLNETPLQIPQLVLVTRQMLKLRIMR